MKIIVLIEQLILKQHVYFNYSFIVKRISHIYHSWHLVNIIDLGRKRMLLL